MLPYITLEEAETRFEELIERVELGETIVVMRDGKPVVDFRPHNQALGLVKGRKLDPCFRRGDGMRRKFKFLQFARHSGGSQNPTSRPFLS